MPFQFIWIVLTLLFSSISFLLIAGEVVSSLTFYLVRHGQTDWNVQKRIQGQLDIPLNKTGRAEATKLAFELKEIPFSSCFSSDLQRAYETAFILTKNFFPFSVIHTDKRLRERHFGKWEGHLFSEFYYADSEEKTGIESTETMQQRVWQCLKEVAATQRNESHVLIVTHGGVLRNLILPLLDLDYSATMQIKNTAVLVLSYTAGEWLIKELKGIVLPLEQLSQ